MATKINFTEESYVKFYKRVINFRPDQFAKFWEDHCPDTREEIQIYGKKVAIPRFQKLYGEFSYKYSGTVIYPDPVYPNLLKACMKIANKVYPQHKWNGALVNFYSDGTQYIGAHSDDEKDLVNGAPILSFSFGGERIFRVKKKKTMLKDGIDKKDFITYDGSMIVIGGNLQKEYLHEVPKTAKKVDRRINITVRCFKPL